VKVVNLNFRKRRRFRLTRVFTKSWVVVVAVVVVGVAGFVVYRVHGMFGKTELTRVGSGLANDTKPFNPKHVTYEVFGADRTVATINYLDLDAQPQKVRNATLPWSLTLTTTAPAASATIVAQGDSGSIGCRIKVDGELRNQNASNGVNAQTFCLVKSA
jgi:Mycobacterium membrane protein